MAYDEEDTEEEESYGNYDDDEDNYDGSGDDTSPNRGRDNEPKNNYRDNSNSDRDRNLNSNSNNYDGSKYDVQITSAPEVSQIPLLQILSNIGLAPWNNILINDSVSKTKGLLQLIISDTLWSLLQRWLR